MIYIRQQYIQFLSWSDTQPHPIPVADRDINKVKMPDDRTYGFYFFERIEGMITLDDGQDVKLVSENRNESPTYYYDAKVYTLEEYRQIKRLDKKWQLFLWHARSQGWERVVVMRTGEVTGYCNEIIITPTR